MMMHAIRWYRRRSGQHVVVGDWDAVIEVANMLERESVKFKVSSVSGIVLDQDQTSFGGFLCWLDRDAKFEDESGR